MREIQLKDAKANLSAVVDDAVRGEEFVITRHGHKEAVVVSWETWRKLSNVPSFGRFLAAAPLDDADLAERDETPLRDPGL
ncbi:prevent-host-death family protein [Roseiarcus fermentans]|uniref:Antitoxin n=1 Tax=Roseiarcus fermentans TaxID=1473586 RepID=A0A366FUH7_9HYPH|nr:type II toxin-antitoxin system Phd/YefM family antitoxin [Roseiarcus fermentans]RBP17710.1 prevent-host-death family protein [Roseiarcus fermentans]